MQYFVRIIGAGAVILKLFRRCLIPPVYGTLHTRRLFIVMSACAEIGDVTHFHKLSQKYSLRLPCAHLMGYIFSVTPALECAITVFEFETDACQSHPVGLALYVRVSLYLLLWSIDAGHDHLWLQHRSLQVNIRFGQGAIHRTQYAFAHLCYKVKCS